MLDEIFGLPTHPLAVHAPVVLVPMLILLAVAYVLIPFIRTAFVWPYFLLCIFAPASVYVARETGLRFDRRLSASAPVSKELADQIKEHQGYGTMLFWLVVALAVVSLLFIALDRGARRAKANNNTNNAPANPYTAATPSAPSAPPAPAARGRVVIMLVSGLFIMLLAAASGWYVFQSGESGARMVWSGS